MDAFGVLKSCRDVESFATFLRLCVGRSGQELVLQTLGADAGISQPTAREWLSVLEASFLCHRLSPWHRNLRKQTIKTPKLHFFDSGLMCFLLGIRSPAQLQSHPLRGAVFESWVAAEIYKARANAGQAVRLSHYREARGAEVDIVVDTDRALLLVEAKSGATIAGDYFSGLDALDSFIGSADPHRLREKLVVFGGAPSGQVRDVRTVSWADLQAVKWNDDRHG